MKMLINSNMLVEWSPTSLKTNIKVGDVDMKGVISVEMRAHAREPEYTELVLTIGCFNIDPVEEENYNMRDFFAWVLKREDVSAETSEALHNLIQKWEDEE